MPAKTPLSAAEKKRILKLANEGMSRAKIAKDVGRALSTVAKLCRDEGLISQETLPAAFVEARALSVKERQVEARERKLAIDELYDAKVLANLRDGTPWTTRKKGKGGAEMFVQVEMIPSDDYRNAASAGAAIASAFKSYAPLETGADVTAAESVVDSLMDGFKTLYRNATKKDEVESGDE